MELPCSWHELSGKSDSIEYQRSCVYNSLCVRLERVVEGLKVVSKYLKIDSVQNFLFWDTEGNHGEVTRESHINDE